MSEGGKGSYPRPIPNRKQFEENWDKIFGKKKRPCEDHEWKFRDDSFSHEFGTERVHYFECEICGATREAEDADYEFEIGY